MDPAAFRAQLERYPRVRDRTFVFRRGEGARPQPRAPAASPAEPAHRATSTAAAATAPLPSAAYADFWAGLTALLTAKGVSKADQKRVMASFEDLHYSVAQDSSLEDLEDVCLLLAAAVQGASPAAATAVTGAPVP